MSACGKVERPERVVCRRMICGEERRLDDPQQPFTRGWLQYANQRSLGHIPSMPEFGHEQPVGVAAQLARKGPSPRYCSTSKSAPAVQCADAPSGKVEEICGRRLTHTDCVDVDLTAQSRSVSRQAFRFWAYWPFVLAHLGALRFHKLKGEASCKQPASGLELFIQRLVALSRSWCAAPRAHGRRRNRRSRTR